MQLQNIQLKEQAEGFIQTSASVIDILSGGKLSKQIATGMDTVTISTSRNNESI